MNPASGLFSGIPWSIPIPQKDYPLIAICRTNGRRGVVGSSSAVKNHTFFSGIRYSPGSIATFWRRICPPSP
ncbi:MAG TPA: hypothetical protein DD781_23075 [Leclercia adecarboxylata]|nr:hypothetical protein C3F35_21525 [Leclercia sp. LSNIH3]POW69291.1 hypothetical protein C3373_18945 [Leclercia sp. LSNIH4]HAF51571.1 hypothetical protein [Leclercia adecarboxylata]HAG02091.1 hypothetical protein [Leclercia adecarboxylata]HBQ69019.1 hypothetical protein [Leclercia adecarboxylata]